MIEVSGVTKSYNGVTPVQDMSFQIEQGEFVAIIGPSGSGKTTLLNLVAGLLTPTSGEVIHCNSALYELDHHDRVSYRRNNFGFVFQTFNLIPYLTVVENVEVPLYLTGVSSAVQAYMAAELLARFGLADKADRFPSQLSVGEQQRVAVARATANAPRVIFADEPTGNLDRSNGSEVMWHLKELNAKGVTVLLVTHDSEMARFAERKIRLVNGGES
ncbi:MAG: ABC transporter ATP-binding protein [Candidatus Krumholzibacteriia bacterium]